MYYDYIIMANNPMIRTQISLPADLKLAIEAKCRLTGESLSAYLRKAARRRLASEAEEERELKKLAGNFVGAGKWGKSHHYWGDKKTVRKWLNDLRSQQELNEALSS